MENTEKATTHPAGEPLSSGRLSAAAKPLKVVAGIDPHESFEPVIQTLRSLSPGGLEVHLVHAFDAEPSGNASGRGRQAELTLKGAREALEASGLGAAWIQRTSDPVRALIEVAEAEHADFIAIGPPRAGGGRVAKGLLDQSPVSLLVAKTIPNEPGELSAVLATDHSEFMERCIRRLVAMGPRGLKEIVVLTANEIVAGAAAMLVHGLPDLADKAEQWISEKITEENRKLCELLATTSAACRPQVLQGYPNEVIAKAMAANRADLLVIGAPKHGALERFAFGSVSAEEVLHSPYSVLALRP